MASGALFGNANARSTSKNLVEFKAGKMYMKGKMVHPDKRKGQVYVYQSDDSLMHFCWKDRTKGTVDDDLMIFPDDVEFRRVTACTTGRVYVLTFKSNNKKMFFWMQEPKTDKDDEYCRKVNEMLNNPPTPGSTRSGGGLSGLPSELASGLGGDSDWQSMLGGMSQQQLLQLLGGGVGGLGGLSSVVGGRPSSSQSDFAPASRAQSSPAQRTPAADTAQQRPVTAAGLSSSQSPSTELTDTSDSSATITTVASESTETPTDTSSATRQQIMLSDLQNILSGLGGEAGAATESVDLSTVVTPAIMAPILANSEVQERLLPFLPDGESLPKTEEELRTTLTTPQFTQAMASFSAALSSGQLGPLMNQFGLGEEVANAAAKGDVEAFAKAMQDELAKPDKKPDDEKK